MLIFCKMWLAVVTYFSVMSIARAQSAHPSCTYQTLQYQEVLLNCEQGGYILPTNFDTALLASNDRISQIRIAGDGNVALERIPPLPFMLRLQTVELYNFNEQSEAAFPLSRFLHTVKPALVKVALVNVKLVRLTATDFNGFTYLTQLSIQRCNLSSIAADTFSGLGLLLSGAMSPNYRSHLSTLRIGSNPDLTGVDWSFLAPISQSLETCDLRGNALQTDKLIKSQNFRLLPAAKIYLQDNNLTTVPSSVLDTFPENLPMAFTVSLIGNPLCQNNPPNDCSCCELAEFGEWANKHQQRNPTISFNCGTLITPIQLFSLSVFRNTSMHEHCKNSAPTLEPTTEPVPTGPVPTRPVPTPATEKPVDPQPCETATQPVRSVCSKNVLTRPSLGPDYMAIRFELTIDSSRRCSNIVYDLHVWLLQKANLPVPIGGRIDGGLVVNCRGDGELSLSERDPDAVESGNIVLDVGTTWKCLEIYFDFIKHVLTFS